MKGCFSDTKYILYTYVLICKHIYGRIERKIQTNIHMLCWLHFCQIDTNTSPQLRVTQLRGKIHP